MRGGDDRTRRAHQAVAVSRDDRRATGTSRAEERLAIYRRYVELARAHWGRRRPRTRRDRTPDRAEFDEHARTRVREFLRWHVGFWVRYVPRRPDGTWPTHAAARVVRSARSPLEALLARTDEAALDYITDALIDDGDCEPARRLGIDSRTRSDRGGIDVNMRERLRGRTELTHVGTNGTSERRDDRRYRTLAANLD